MLEAVALLGSMAHEVEHLKHHALETACRMVEAEAKRGIGTYDYGWLELAPRTKVEREWLGFSENEPLLRTGDLRASIGHEVEGHVGYIGSNNPKAVWNFLGTSTIPARDPILGAIQHIGPEIEARIGHGFYAWLGGRGLPARQIY